MLRARVVLPIVCLAALLAACGGSATATLAKTDVAVVGSAHVTRTAFDELMAQARQTFKTQGRSFPKVGTSTYQTLTSQAVTLLVQKSEREQKATSMGITVSDAEVQQRIDQIKQQYFGGSQKRYLAALAKQHYTDAAYRDNLRTLILAQKLFDQVTKDVKVTDAEALAYYTAHPALYNVPQSRLVRHILVKSKALADTLYAQLKSGNDATWCTLAKKYSLDPGSKAACGKLLPDIKKGATVPPFDKVAFTEKTNVVAPPVHSQFGWHVIEPIGDVKPATTQSFAKVKATISQQLLQDKKNQVMTDWVNSLTKEFCGGSKLKYQVGYQPSPDPCSTVTTSTATTN